MELLSIPPHSTSASSTKVLVLDGTTAKSRTAQQLRIDGGGAAEIHAPTHASNGSDPLEISQSQVFDSLQLEDGSFLLAENGKKLSIQGVDDIRDLITAVRTVSASDAILGRKSPGSGFFEELTISDALDFIGTTARGDIIYRGVDGWERLPAGTSGQFLRTLGANSNPQWASVTNGTVTSVSVSGDNGVLATVTNPSNTPTINIGLGDITPDSVNGVVLSGTSTPSLAVTGSSSISGSNTGDQTIALTGDVTGSGTGSFLTSIGSGKVTYQKIQNVTQLRILGRKSSPTGIVEECTLSEVLDFVTNAAWGDLMYRGQTGWSRLPAGTSGQFLKTMGTTGDPQWATVTGTGTVTSVSASGANGVTATVTNPSTTPSISIGLGAITPTSVNGVVLSGSSTPSLAVTGTSSISGANTGDQTITLTGDVTGTGTGSFAASIGDGKVTYQKIQNVTPLRILGRKGSPAGIVEECSLSEVLDFVTNAAWGDLLYRGQTGWARLPAGTNGQFLKTQGSSGNPVWATVSAGSSTRHHDFSFSRGDTPSSHWIPAQGQTQKAWPFSEVNVFTVFKPVFVPTNYQLTVMFWDLVQAQSAVGFTLQYATNGATAASNWQDIASFDVRGSAGFRSFSGTMNLGSPADLYFRLNSYSLEASGSVQINTIGMTLSVWN
jgi:hypothetical protein